MPLIAKDIPVIDSHFHLWDLSRFPYKWLAPTAPPARFGDKSKIGQNYLPANYLADMNYVNLIGCVHVQANCGAEDVSAETEWLSSHTANTSVPNAAIAEADIAKSSALKLIERHAKYSITRGIRTPVAWDTQGRWRVASAPRTLSDPQFLRGARLLCDLDLALEMVVVPEQLEELAEFANLLPELRIIVNHFGHPEPEIAGNVDVWFAGITRLASCPNVFLKLSGLWTIDRSWAPTVLRPFVNHAMDSLSASRLMYGSNYPVESVNCTIANQFQSLAAILENRSAECQHRIFSGTANAAYKLGLQV